MARNGPHCYRCGTPLDLWQGDDCPHCGYPVNRDKEQVYLKTSITNLEQELRYTGNQITVLGLLQFYRARLQQIVAQTSSGTQTAAPGQGTPTSSPANAAPGQGTLADSASPPTNAAPGQTPLPVPPLAAATAGNGSSSAPLPPKRVFSFKSFFADQTITIVASLGAFLIVIGSLSFLVTTHDLLLSFLVLLIVHALFGTTGVISRRFPSFRIVSAIYTAIFALQVPLVGFSAYRLLTGNAFPLSPPTLVAIAALYAMLVYAALAVYQQFPLFGYLAAVSLLVADLAVASAFNLSFWWYPSALLALALPLLAPLSRTPSVPARWLRGGTRILFLPSYILMFACIPIAVFALLCFTLYSFGLDAVANPTQETRNAIVCTTILLSIWLALYVWRAHRLRWLHALPYALLASVLAVLYACRVDALGYALGILGVAWLYYAAARLHRFIPQAPARLWPHLAILTLILLSSLPSIVAPLLLLQFFARAYNAPAWFFQFQATSETPLDIALLLLGVLLTVLVILERTGWQRVPRGRSAPWCWFLILNASLLFSAYNLALLALYVALPWGLLALTLLLLALAIGLRRWGSAAWAGPVDVLTLLASAQTLLLGRESNDMALGLLLGFAVLAYAVALYQARPLRLLVPVAFALLAGPLLFTYPRLNLTLSLLLPLASVVALRLSRRRPARRHRDWELPLLFIGALYGAIFALHDATVPISTLQSWSTLPCSYTLELALLALVWYASAVLARQPWWQLPTLGFAIVALVLPANSFWLLTVLVPLLMLHSWAAARIAGTRWTLVPAILATVTVVTMGIAGVTQGHVSEAVWLLQLFALLFYGRGVVERNSRLKLFFLWLAVAISSWSLYDAAGILGDLYRPPAVALVSTLLALLVGQLPIFKDRLDQQVRARRLTYTLPLYATGLVAALFTGLYGSLGDINRPFFAAIPTALFVYALLAYAVVTIERRPGLLWLVAGFTFWGTLLLLFKRSCSNTLAGCSSSTQLVLILFAMLALLSGLVGLLSGPLQRRSGTSPGAPFTWSWPWYATTLLATTVALVWNSQAGGTIPRALLLPVLLGLLLFALVIMLLERVPEMVLVAIALAAYLIAWSPLANWQYIGAYSLLCTLIFAGQFVWRRLTPRVRSTPLKLLHCTLGLVGQSSVVLACIALGGFRPGADLLTHSGAFALTVLALLLLWSAFLTANSKLHRACLYGTGLLLSVVVSWELRALGQNDFALLTLPPASYLIVIAPFLLREDDGSWLRRVGQFCAFAGALLLLLPALWLSFSGQQFLMTLLLGGEALALLIVGTLIRLRFFVLSGAALVIVSAIHLLFLPSLGIPSFLALTLIGIMLLAIASGLILVRTRLASLWDEMD